MRDRAWERRPGMLGTFSTSSTHICAKPKSTGRGARVLRKLDDNHFEVEMGAMKMKIARDDIAEVLTSARSAADTPVKAARARGISVSLENESANVPSEINVIGQTVDAAS